MGGEDRIGKSLIKAASNAPYLEREEEQDLAIRWVENQDQNALHQLTSAHMRLVIAVASKFRRYGLPMSDLVQEGHVGLLEAAARFDPHREVRFSTYATWWIRASIQDYILRNWSIVRGGTSSGQKSLFFNLRRLRAKITAEDNNINTQDLYCELANAIGVSVKDVATMDARLSGADVSLNAPVSTDEESGSERQDFIESEEALPDAKVSEMIDGERRSEWLHSALDVLNERELRIVNRRRLSEKGATLEELGNELGISKERVRQLENRALKKLQTELVNQNPEIVDLVHSSFQ
ncbi:MAG: RNA polymerase factor sigma-32 [Pseudomonadota bacterium]